MAALEKRKYQGPPPLINISVVIFVFVHMWPPLHCAGSEVTVHAAMREMVTRGHEVTVVADQTPESYEYEGVKVLSLSQQGYKYGHVKQYAQGANILITHLDCTSQAMQLQLDMHRPLVHFVHNHRQLGPHPGHRVSPNKAQLVIFNSHWIAKKQQWEESANYFVPWPGSSIVIHPIVEPHRYKCERGDKITLCNPTSGKGVDTIHKLSEVMPDYEFLIVEGIYGEQIAPPNLGDEWIARHPNVEHMKNSPDFRDVLRKTRILLMPSDYESYGRCAVEAACAGIPSIVHPTEGLLESLDAKRPPTREELKGGWVSGAGIFCDRDDIPSWKAQIERLYTDEVYYRGRSDAALKLAASLDSESEFDRLEDALITTLEHWDRTEEAIMAKMHISEWRLWWGPGGPAGGILLKEVDGRIPSAATSFCCPVGGEVDEDLAIKHGFIAGPPDRSEIMDTKALTEPAENKAIQSPEAIKKRGRKARVA